ncbi:hypothetical protein [Kordiimonas marina]|uniref:hypothetical protein n=1 Tax=Kordiimonas marina TaxID=2872312 RepID=UPI001FF16ED0|nr:hypothetical protein [Kordiimonas marina]MCJ9428393.1 hypothetical protein [Kordiimonas marina]
MTDTEDMTALAERFLDLWQDNVRAWAAERDLLTPEDLADLLKDHIQTGGGHD